MIFCKVENGDRPVRPPARVSTGVRCARLETHKPVPISQLVVSVNQSVCKSGTVRASSHKSYSYLSAAVGATRVARRAGISAAAIAISSRIDGTAAKVSGSVAATW